MQQLVLLGYFYFDMDIMVSEAVATNASDSLPCQVNPLVCLDACGDLEKQKIQSFITLYAFSPLAEESENECGNLPIS